MLDNNYEYDSIEDAAGGGRAGYAADQYEYGYYQQQPGHGGHSVGSQHRDRGPAGRAGPMPPPARQWQPQQQQQQQYHAHRYHQQQWPNAAPWPKHGDAAAAADAADPFEHYPPTRPFRLQNPPPPGPPRPSSSPRPVLELRTDAHVAPGLTSAHSDSFYYGSRPARHSPSPTPTVSYSRPAPRTRAESTPTPRQPLAPTPRSAFPGLSSNPFIPESPESDTSHTEPRKPLLVSRHHDQLARLSPVSNLESPVESRQGTPTESNMVVENFSRPRKPSVRLQQSDGALSWRMAAQRAHADPPLLDQPPTSNPQISTNFNPAPNPWPRSRRLSASSSHSSSTFSSIPPRPSNDYLNPAPRGDSLRHANPAATGPPVSFSRPPPTHYNHHGPQTHLREVPPWLAAGDEFRSSFRSQFTSSTAHGTLFTANGTERNSVLTKASSITEQSIINGYARGSWRANSVDEGPSLEDVMGMYERGFRDSVRESDLGSIRPRSMRFLEDDDTPETDADVEVPGMESSRPGTSHSDASVLRARMLEAMNDDLPSPKAVPIPESGLSTARQSRTRHSLLPNSLPKEIGLGLAAEHVSRRNKTDSANMEKHDSAKLLDADTDTASLEDEEKAAAPSPPSPISPTSPTSPAHAKSPTPDTTPSHIVTLAPIPSRHQQEPAEGPGSRDRYGFLKASANVTRQEYDAWDTTYCEYLDRRRKKWNTFLKDNSLMTDQPNRFPPRSAKTKRFIRKGIPPDWRGAAWFYYAGGPAILSKHRGVYEQLVKRAGLEPTGSGRIPNFTSEVKALVVEDIEKDLYRTFPDNIRFKPPPPPPGAPPPNRAGAPPSAEPEIIASLRRVLYAFALYNPRIGYCQSLNFLAGLLLLFVETEEQAFWLLNIITRVYLPGTHEMSLEGSKVDLGVLMIALKDSMPGVWKQIGGDELEAGKKSRGRLGRGHGGNSGSISDPNRLPAITFCMTAWFMSCFIGTLPIETVLRVWDVFFYEGSRTLFRISLALFKLGEREIRAVQDPMEMFGVVQAFPRRMLDCNTLMETCYKRRNGIGHLSQEAVEEKRQERRDGIRKWKAEQEAAAAAGDENGPRPATRHRFGAAALGLDLAVDLDEVRRKAALFGRRQKDREQVRAAEVV